MSGPEEIARAAWGAAPPDWIEVLARACARTSQNQVAKRLGRSASLVSTVLRGSYRGDMAAVEERVRGVLMARTVDCPALGTIPAQVCQDWRARARSFAGVNALRVQMFRACRNCPRNRKEDRDVET
ncbi:MAG: hypothetical protein KDA73_10540 [Rhodobacteraceae bacterium]|nr:hypothetical protein [Paracoccaceae bacterium]